MHSNIHGLWCRLRIIIESQGFSGHVNIRVEIVHVSASCTDPDIPHTWIVIQVRPGLIKVEVCVETYILSTTCTCNSKR